MFTGIIAAIGTVREFAPHGKGAHLRVSAPRDFLQNLQPGDSIAVSGCCLTITRLSDVRGRGELLGFEANVAAETLRRTAFRRLRRGEQLNLEQPLRAGALLSGHLVQGHVDSVGVLRSLKPVESRKKASGWWMEIDLPSELLPFVIWKGSLAVEGISLTIASLDANRAGFAVIPFTWKHTNLQSLKPGSAVNLEADLLARYVDRLLALRVLPGSGEAKAPAKKSTQPGRRKKALSWAELRQQGF